MASPDWLVKLESPDVLSDWLSTVDPVAAIRFNIWFFQVFLDGPPPLEGHTPDGVGVVRTPEGVFVELVTIPKPLALGVDPPVCSVVIRRISQDNLCARS